MATKIFKLDHFAGGVGDSNKEGGVGTVNFNRSLDIYSEPTTTQLLPKTSKISSSTVVDLIKWFANTNNGDIYGYGDTGHIYKNTSGSITDVHTAPSSHGNGMAYFDNDDYLYYLTDTLIGRYGPLSNSPTFTDDFFSDGTFDLDISDVATGSTYALGTSVSETATNKHTFTPNKDPQKSVQINIDTIGTGDWTVVIHDAFNNVMATKTIANGSLSTGLVTFTFSSVWRIINGSEFHAHVYSSVADGIAVSSSSNDFETADFYTYFQILVSDSDYHPAIDFFETIIFGNGTYLGLWDGFTPPIESNRIKLPAGYKCRTLTKLGEYVVAGCWRGSAITSNEQGLLIFWDGVSTDFNFSVEVPEGGIQAMVANQNRLFFIAGSTGNLYVYTDGYQKMGVFPKMTNQTYMEVGPGAMTNWQSFVEFGASVNSDSTVIEKGIYSFGHMNKSYAEALNYSFPISTGTRTGTTLKIGAVLGQGQTLHIGWRDNTAYGWDTTNNSSTYFTSGLLETLIFDDNTPYHQKEARTIRVDHTALANGESIQIAYKIDRASSWTTGTANSTVGADLTRLNVNSRFKEIEIQVTIGGGTTTPIVTSVSMEFNDLEGENIF